MKNIYIFSLFSLLLSFSLLFVSPHQIYASEGTLELKSTGPEPYRCFAVSIRMLEPEYRILFTCKYILYPAEEDVFNYIVWSSPIDGKKAVKLGSIGQGRVEFKTKIPFSELFVTTELTKDVKAPSGRVVMRGNVKPIQFLEEANKYGPTSVPVQLVTSNSVSPTISPSVTLTTSTREKLFTAFKRAGVAALVAIVALVGLIFVITRSRG